MRILLAIALAIVFGLAVGVGTAMLRHASAPYGGPGGLPRHGPPQIDPSDPIRPKLAISSARYEFGRMFIGEDGKHDFVLRNDGNAPLEIRKDKKTCRCTDVKIEKSTILPGRSATVTISWRSDQQVDGSREIAHATIRTTDPARQSIKLTVLGRIIPAARAVPAELVFDDLSGGESRTVRVRLYGYVKRPLKILGIDLADKRTTEHFETAIEPLPTAEIEKEPDALSGHLLRVTVKPGLPLGAFRQKILIRTNVATAPKIEVPVVGTVVGDIKIVAVGRGWADDTGTLTLGPIESGEGVTRQMLLIVRGPHRREVAFGPVRCVPEFVDVQLGEERETETSVTMPVTIRIPRDSPAANYLGGEQGEQSEIMIETGHPQVPPVRIRLRFAVESSDD
ncbi:MAG: DUF1573 domain-containing protein [Candidatus Nealsonbacteria bacterium]|nr:DUF1573 domain-containing protein [Candidatus Nealsonbacteria bacterium]